MQLVKSATLLFSSSVAATREGYSEGSDSLSAFICVMRSRMVAWTVRQRLRALCQKMDTLPRSQVILTNLRQQMNSSSVKQISGLSRMQCSERSSSVLTGLILRSNSAITKVSNRRKLSATKPVVRCLCWYMVKSVCPSPIDMLRSSFSLPMTQLRLQKYLATRRLSKKRASSLLVPNLGAILLAKSRYSRLPVMSHPMQQLQLSLLSLQTQELSEALLLPSFLQMMLVSMWLRRRPQADQLAFDTTESFRLQSCCWEGRSSILTPSQQRASSDSLFQWRIDTAQGMSRLGIAFSRCTRNSSISSQVGGPFSCTVLTLSLDSTSSSSSSSGKSSRSVAPS